jgi:hypothetical protein
MSYKERELKMDFHKTPWILVSLCALAAVQMGCASDETPQQQNAQQNPYGYAGAGGAAWNGMYAGTGGWVAPVAGTGGAAAAGIGGAGVGGGVVGGAAGSALPVVTPGCGNGQIDPGEDCESALPLAATCESLGQGAGTVICDAACHYDLSGCAGTAGLFTVNYEISSAIGTVGIVTWSTTVNPVTEAYIQFGLDTNYGMTAPVDLNEPNFRTLLLGMKGSRDYHFRIVAKSGTTEYVSGDYVLTTGPVTNLVQVLEKNIDNEAARARGFIVTSVFQSGPGGGFPGMGGFGGSSSAMAFIVDADGDIVWWHSSSLSSSTRARMSYDGKYMWIVTAGMDPVNGLERVSMDGLDSQTFATPATHDVTAVTGNVMAFLAGGFTGCVVLTEITPDGVMTPVFDTNQVFFGGSCHANSIRYSETEGVYTLSDLNQGDIIWIDRASKQLVQRLSDYSFNWGGHQHGQHFLGGSILIFNNGDNIAQEISLDPATRRSAEIWRYGTNLSSTVLGDVQRLPNGNTMVTYSTAGRIHEVGSNSMRIMEFRFSQTTGYSVWRESLYGPPPDVTL